MRSVGKVTTLLWSILAFSCSQEGAEVAKQAVVGTEADSHVASCENGVRQACYVELGRSASHLQCGVGSRECQNGRWSSCQVSNKFEQSREAALIADPTVCDSCHPKCFKERLVPNDRDLTGANSNNLEYSGAEGGLVLKKPGMGGGGGAPPEIPAPIAVDGDDEAVERGPDGAIRVVGSSAQVGPSSIWIPSTDDGVLERLDTITGNVTGRFWSGPDGAGRKGTGANDPSRTSINTRGDAYIVNRSGSTVTKISDQRRDCPDRNGDGNVRTSTDSTLHPWGTDECVMWNNDLADGSPWASPNAGWNLGLRGAAAQDYLDPVTGELHEYVWVANYEFGYVVLLDGDTGAVLQTIAVPGQPYGLAMDADQNLWVANRHAQRWGVNYPANGRWHTRRWEPGFRSGVREHHVEPGRSFWIDKTQRTRPMTRIDTKYCIEHGCSSHSIASFCNSGHDGHREKTINCDHRPLEIVATPAIQYSITVTQDQRVWITGGDIFIYDRSRNPGSRFTQVGMPNGSTNEPWYKFPQYTGIAADANGWIWVSNRWNLVRISASNPNHRRNIPGIYGYGVAVDRQNKVWMIRSKERDNDPRTTNVGYVTPGPGLNDFSVRNFYEVNNPYVYSDMTGQQLKLASAPLGYFRSKFEACDDPKWDRLKWETETPGDTFISFRARTASTEAGLNSATWVTVGLQPSAGGRRRSSASLAAAFANHGIVRRRWLQVETVMKSEIQPGGGFRTPKLFDLSATNQCVVEMPLDPGRFSHTYDATLKCTDAESPVWKSLRWKTVTPGDSRITLEIRNASTAASVNTAPAIFKYIPPLPNDTMPPPANPAGAIDIDHEITRRNRVPGKYTKVVVHLEPSSDGKLSPTLQSMQAEYDCAETE